MYLSGVKNFFRSLYIAYSFIVTLSARHFLQSENTAGQFPLTLHSRFAWNVQRTHVTVSVQNGKYKFLYTYRQKPKKGILHVHVYCNCFIQSLQTNKIYKLVFFFYN